MALAAKGGPTRGKEKIRLPLRNTNNREKTIPNRCSTDSAQKENPFRISYCAGPAWPFSPPAGRLPRYMGIYIATEGTTKAHDNCEKTPNFEVGFLNAKTHTLVSIEAQKEMKH